MAPGWDAKGCASFAQPSPNRPFAVRPRRTARRAEGARYSARTAQALSLVRSIRSDQCAAASHRAAWKSAKHAAQWAATLARYASRVFGAMPLSDIDTEVVMRALRPVWDTRTETAVPLRGRIATILDWAAVSKCRQGENMARWRGAVAGCVANGGVGRTLPPSGGPVLATPAAHALGLFVPRIESQRRQAALDPVAGKVNAGDAPSKQSPRD